jgi:Ca2+-transporting ATPase
MKTELGHIAEMIQSDETLTPLQIRLSALEAIIHRNSLNLCFYFSNRLVKWRRSPVHAVTSVSLAVAAIPEALSYSYHCSCL